MYCYDTMALTFIPRELSLDELLTLVGRSHRSMDSVCLALCMKNVHRKFSQSSEKEALAAQLKQDLSFQVFECFSFFL